eukprot:GHVR01111336.1.p1 GENE.GHVR01111336.1~~GHVR01111336.1.p1  ORF type:complete len:120 (+),score=35.60 GHVR01111336.1:1-360(+)
MELARVSDLEIIRTHVGKVVWEGITDVRGLDFDSIVEIESEEVRVYGEVDAPRIGEGLNKQALVTLKVEPKKIPADADEFNNFKQRRYEKMKKCAEDQGAEFIDLEYSTWEWTFRVPHF